MSSATLKRLAAILAGILVLWIGLTLFRSYRRDRAVTLSLPRIDRSAVTAVTIARATDTIRLVRQHDTTWTVNGYPAAPGAAHDLLDAVTDSASQGQLVAQSASSYPELGLDSALARRITVAAGDKPLLTVLVGKRADDDASGFVRMPGDADVYQLPGRLAEFADRSLADWRDKAIVQLAPDSVARVEVTRQKGSYTVQRADHGWTIGGAAADSGAVASWLDQLKALSATGFATAAQIDSATHVKAASGIRLIGRDGRPVVALTFDSISTGSFVARRDGDSTAWLLDGYTVKQLTPADSTLRKH
jgi:Domain of unknown function (DUF4340)